MEKVYQKPHAVMIAVPLQGHINPTVQFAMKLASKGFTITFVNLQSVHHKIITTSQGNVSSAENDIFSEARKSDLDIHYTTISDGFPLSFDRNGNHDQYMEGMLHVLSAHVDELVGKLVCSKQPVTCLIADTLFVWPSVIAKKYNLVSISFWTEPAVVFSLYYHLDLLRRNGHFGSQDNRKDVIDYMPGVQAIKPEDLMSYLQDADVGTVMHMYMFKSFEDVKETEFIICNTVQELETEAISALQKIKKVYAVGPIFPPRFTRSIVNTSLWSESDCTKWLSTRPTGSVLYISFGSLYDVSKEVIQEIAHGLMLSKVNFIWILRPAVTVSNEAVLLPAGFQDVTGDRGLVLPWCCQIEVISNPAVGGFLTHCGWNSTLESMWCGVPMLCFPLSTDQPTNRKLIVEDWKIGINLCAENIVSREDIAKRFNSFMYGDSADEQRKNIKEIKKILENALYTDGSSEKNFNQFIHDVKAKIKHKQEISIKPEELPT